MLNFLKLAKYYNSYLNVKNSLDNYHKIYPKNSYFSTTLLLYYLTTMQQSFPKKPIVNQNEPNPIRVSVSEAARLFGVDDRTVRRAIKDQELRYIVVQDRYKINFESLVEWSQKRTRLKNKLAKQGIGQYVDKWKIKNKLYSPNPDNVPKDIPDNKKTSK